NLVRPERDADALRRLEGGAEPLGKLCDQRVEVEIGRGVVSHGVRLTQPGNWPGPGPVDWAAIRDWDERYYAHVFVSAEEYVHQAVVRADGDFVELADGSRL